jgi:hypothetical protein
MTPGRALLAGVGIVLGGFLLWEFGPLQMVRWVGRIDLVVHIDAPEGVLRAVSCQAYGSRSEVDAPIDLGFCPETSPWSASARPFQGKALTVPIPVSGTASPLGRELSWYQHRYLVVIGDRPDGSRRAKLVEIPDGRIAREVTVAFP